ncbi:MAG: hypothetical protein A3H99_09275 [Gallionellales bacterium RIFCSPLOWO2_02_FULL_59_110]|nr:MAG: hypothetical protein A3H99_09275 [Gallionellales bacterium RIFCSPLOWO2_02_FULL_59_110]
MSLPGQQDSNPETGSGHADDRRVHGNLRPIFEQACRITAPFFDPKQGWGGMSLTMYARQVLRETFPDLSQQETAILFSAVQRFHKTPTNH